MDDLTEEELERLYVELDKMPLLSDEEIEDLVEQLNAGSGPLYDEIAAAIRRAGLQT